MENKMKRIISLLLALVVIFSAFSLTSCGKKSDAPEGMQLVQGGEKYGYYFYGPEEWVVANHGSIACTYASAVDLSSMTFAETAKPDVSITDYFTSEVGKFPYEITVTTNAESCSFGDADKLAKKYVYTYTYKTVSYTCMQIFVTHSDRFYIFTYTANNTDRTPEATYYEYYLEKVNSVIDNFKFTDKSAANEETPAYDKDSDGYILVSDKVLTGFNFYVPEDYKVDYSSGLVSVSRADGTNITLAETTYPATNQDDYWNNRRESIDAVADKITNEKTGESQSSFKEIKAPYTVEVKGADAAAAYEYSYILGGVEYRVYQVLMRKGTIGGHVYVFTYTATADNYDSHLSEANTILNKIEY